MTMKLWLVATVSLVAWAGQAWAADEAPAKVSEIVVTATRVPEAADQVPADISVVSGKDLRSRGAHDLASALALVPGVEAPAGGDCQAHVERRAICSGRPARVHRRFLAGRRRRSLGRRLQPDDHHHLDAVNGDGERIEVLKGSAPVMYGATSFVAVAQELHYPAGEAANVVDLAYGNYGSAKGDVNFLRVAAGGRLQILGGARRREPRLR